MRNRRKKFNTEYIITIIIFGIILISVLAGLALNTSSSNNADDAADVPLPTVDLNTPAPTPVTFPTVDPAGPNLTLNPPVVNNQGLFQVSVPEGFIVRTNVFDPSLLRARITFGSPATEYLSVMDILLNLGVNFPSHQALSDNYLTPAYFAEGWASYENPVETGRTVGETVVVNFNLISTGQPYLGRQISWLDQDWLHSVRLVVPANNPALLDALEAEIVPTFISYNDQREEPISWVAAIDRDQEFLIRHPNWETSSAGSVIESRSFPAKVVMRTIADTPLTSLDEAEVYVSETLRPDAETRSVQVITREFGSGYLVSYQSIDPEGNPVSGLVALLNDETNNLHIAELQLSEPEIDLLALDTDSPYSELLDVIRTFIVLPSEGYTITPAANPLATEAPVATEEPTEAPAGETSEPGATEEASVPAETAEATAEQ